MAELAVGRLEISHTPHYLNALIQALLSQVLFFHFDLAWQQAYISQLRGYPISKGRIEMEIRIAH